MTLDGKLVIARVGLKSDALQGEVVLITGAGGGIGYEAARALLWLGANVVIAEINQDSGYAAAKSLGNEFSPERVLFVQTDVGDESSVQNLYQESILGFGKVDAVINNATIAVLGAVKDVAIEKWDASYRVNLRGPVLMARTFLPGMLARKHGTFVCVSSTGTAFLGGYETFKAAQVHLANTLDAELEGTNVSAYTIGPGLVPTRTAADAVAEIAPLMGMSLDEFYKLNQNAMLTIEEAGAGFAASIVFAEKFRGQEISSTQALKAADINFGSNAGSAKTEALAGNQMDLARQLCARVRQTLKEQSEDWKRRSIFERQWVIRDFKKTAGMPAEEWLDTLAQLEGEIRAGGAIRMPALEKLASYYNHLAELAKGYEKDPVKLEENLKYVYGWKEEVEQLSKTLH
jgi:NAD(P)-dependent dehydrogenase (short-subunit alcohol dehydrogenase family)